MPSSVSPANQSDMPSANVSTMRIGGSLQLRFAQRPAGLQRGVFEDTPGLEVESLSGSSRSGLRPTALALASPNSADYLARTGI